MRLQKIVAAGCVSVLCMVLAACGGGGGGGPSSPPVAVDPPVVPTSVSLQGEARPYYPAKSYQYSQASANIFVTAVDGRVNFQIQGDENWTADFALGGVGTLTSGTYGNVTRYPSNPAGTSGMNVYGPGWSCSVIAGTFTVSNVSYSNGVLASIDVDFAQYCEGQTAALRGQIHWDARDKTKVAGPITPVPLSLWSAPATSVPAAGNYIYLISDIGDYIGGGRSYTYTNTNAALSFTSSNAHLSVGVNGDQRWNADFLAMSSVTQLEPGYYADLKRYPFNSPVRGGLSWSGEGRGCNTLSGWFVVDKVSYSSGRLSAIELRFEQRCESGTTALRGQMRWSASDNSTALGPVNAPQGLWAPPASSLPSSGNYVYLSSDPGDFIGAGKQYTYTNTNASLVVAVNGGKAGVAVRGDEDWSGDFLAMSTLSELQTGYYGDLRRYPFHNPVKGGLSWTGEGRGCNTLTGWFMVDRIIFVGGVLTELDLRFEQHCEGGSTALRGKVHWTSSDTSLPPGPVNPPPQGLWSAPAGSTPASGNYVFLKSDVGDYIGGGQQYLYTDANSISLSGSGTGLAVSVGGWRANFVGMNSITQLQPGYYGGLQRHPFHSAVKGGLDWSGNGRGCNTLTGWFVIDSVSYVNGNLTALDLRFEQHCEGGSPALRGQIHWVKP